MDCLANADPVGACRSSCRNRPLKIDSRFDSISAKINIFGIIWQFDQIDSAAPKITIDAFLLIHSFKFYQSDK